MNKKTIFKTEAGAKNAAVKFYRAQAPQWMIEKCLGVSFGSRGVKGGETPSLYIPVITMGQVRAAQAFCRKADKSGVHAYLAFKGFDSDLVAREHLGSVLETMPAEFRSAFKSGQVRAPMGSRKHEPPFTVELTFRDDRLTPDQEETIGKWCRANGCSYLVYAVALSRQMGRLLGL